MYLVVLLTDYYTPMEFVVNCLQRIFGKNEEEASLIMLKVHHEGRGVCGVYPRDIAATRVEMVRQLAHARQHPLPCLMEPAPAAAPQRRQPWVSGRIRGEKKVRGSRSAERRVGKE